MTFFALLYEAIHMTGTCLAVSQSTHSQIDTQQPVVFGGSCLDALFIVLQSHGYLAWIWP